MANIPTSLGMASLPRVWQYDLTRNTYRCLAHQDHMRSPSRRRFLQIIAATSVSGLAMLRADAALGSTLQRWDGEALGADASISLAGLDPRLAEEILRACRDEIARLEEVFSLYSENFGSLSPERARISCRSARGIDGTSGHLPADVRALQRRIRSDHPAALAALCGNPWRSSFPSRAGHLRDRSATQPYRFQCGVVEPSAA